MKKIFLLLGMVSLVFGLMAKEVPNVIVHKSDGGHQAVLNLYNDIKYTPSTTEGVPATLDCSGKGWSYCRVPVNALGITANTSINTSARREGTTAETKAFVDAINSIIENSEKLLESGTLSGSQSITVAIPSNSRTSKYTTYYVKGQWSYNKEGNGVLKFFITQSPLTGRAN